MRNIALKLMYNGSAYHGWQVQKTVSSVCETMEKGLSKVCGGNVKLVGTETKTTVRTVHYCRVSRSGDLLELKVCADGFLYNMVRAITGTVLYAAEGKLTPEDIPEILASGDRSLAGPTVPPGGLYMTRLWYEDERLND